jgi:hypothetical protein
VTRPQYPFARRPSTRPDALSAATVYGETARTPTRRRASRVHPVRAAINLAGIRVACLSDRAGVYEVDVRFRNATISQRPLRTAHAWLPFHSVHLAAVGCERRFMALLVKNLARASPYPPFRAQMRLPRETLTAPDCMRRLTRFPPPAFGAIRIAMVFGESPAAERLSERASSFRRRREKTNCFGSSS